MAEPKFTPGPWGFDESGAAVANISANGTHRVIANLVDWLGYGETGRRLANARLIAAAPDLYAAAKLALDEMVRTNAPRDSFTDAVDALDAALSRCDPLSIEDLRGGAKAVRSLGAVQVAKTMDAAAAELETLRADKRRLDWLALHVVNVRDKLLYGSRDMFWASPEGDEEATEYGPSNLRAQIDARLKAKSETEKST